MHYRHFCFWFTYECPSSTALKNCSYLSNKIMFSPLFTLHPCDRWNAIVVRCTVALQKQMVNVRLRRKKNYASSQNPLFQVKLFSRTQPLFDRTADALDSTTVSSFVLRGKAVSRAIYLYPVHSSFYSICLW